MKKIIPSIIAKNQIEFDERMSKIGFSKLIQLDIMDGKFVKQNSLDFDLELPRGDYEAHLMIKNPEEWIAFNYSFVKSIIFHYESTKQHNEIISLIKSKKRKVGIAISPETEIKEIIPYINKINKVTILSVLPGKYGAKFIPKVLNKIKKLKSINPKIIVQIDGGINNKTIIDAHKHGADEFIVGSFLQKSKRPKEDYNKLLKIIRHRI